MIFHWIQPPFTDSIFVGEYDYQDFVSFLKSEDRCKFIPLNISSKLDNDQSKHGDVCMGFMTTVKNMSAESQISNVEVKYFAFDVQYNYEPELSFCKLDDNLQHVEMMLICRRKTVVNGIRCDENSTCQRKGEVCQKHLDMDQHLCMATRHLYQSCDEYSPCAMNSECRFSGSIKVCQCLDGYADIKGHCVKYGLSLHELCTENKQCTGTENANTCTSYRNEVQLSCQCNDGYIEINSTCYKTNRRLHESCYLSEQCNGSTGANECKYKDGVKICSCPADKVNFNGVCLKVGLTLDKACWAGGQCTGTPNSGVCLADQGKDGKLICQCSPGLIKHNYSCLQENKEFYEECRINAQCSQWLKKGVCTEIRGRKVCMCKKGYVEDNKSMKCRKGNKTINERCVINQQCIATEKANTCRLAENTSRCSCNDGFDLIDGRCLKIGRKLFEKCSRHEQCNGTNNAMNCTDLNEDNEKVCFCHRDYLDFKGRCIMASRKLNEQCETHQQCTGTENGNTCRLTNDSSKCSCNDRFDFIDEKCVKTKGKLSESKHPKTGGGPKPPSPTPVELSILEQLEGRPSLERICGGIDTADSVETQPSTSSSASSDVPAKKKDVQKKDMLLLLIAVGGFLGILTCSLTISFALKRRNSNTKRLECRNSSNIAVRNIRYSVVDNSNCGSTSETTVDNRLSCSKAFAENIYDEAYQREEQGTENVYSCSEPQCYGTQGCDNDTYNHLHQKPIQMSDAIYGVPKSMSESMCSIMQEQRL